MTVTCLACIAHATIEGIIVIKSPWPERDSATDEHGVTHEVLRGGWTNDLPFTHGWRRCEFELDLVRGGWRIPE